MKSAMQSAWRIAIIRLANVYKRIWARGTNRWWCTLSLGLLKTIMHSYEITLHSLHGSCHDLQLKYVWIWQENIISEHSFPCFSKHGNISLALFIHLHLWQLCSYQRCLFEYGSKRVFTQQLVLVQNKFVLSHCLKLRRGKSKPLTPFRIYVLFTGETQLSMDN